MEDWQPPHSHDPNPEPPGLAPDFVLILPDKTEHAYDLAQLQTLPQIELRDVFIRSTGHPATGPFTFGGVRLWDVLQHAMRDEWSEVDVLSNDGFGTRLTRAELENVSHIDTVVLAYIRDGKMLTRQQGAVRLVVPTETDEALRQVKWVGKIILR